MRVRFIRGTALGGIGNDASQGDERDLPEPQAQALVAAGRARHVPIVATPAPQTPPPDDAPPILGSDEASLPVKTKRKGK